MKRLDLLSLVTRSSLLMAARVCGAVIAFAGTLAIARHFGAETLGTVALALAAMGLLAQALCAGRQAVGPLFVSEYLVGQQPERIRGFIKRGYRMIAALSLIAFSLFGVVTIGLGERLGGELTSAFAFACLAAPPVALISFNGGVLTGFRRQLLGLVPDLLVKPLLVLLAILATVALAPQASTVVLLGGICAALWATAGLQALFIHRKKLYPDVPADERDSATWTRKATPWIAIILLADYLIELHLLLAGWLLAPAMVGVLHICFRLRMLASFGMRALYSVVLPEVYAAHARGDTGGLARDITRGNAVVLAYSAAVCATFAALGKPLLGLFGEAFTAGYPALLIISLSMIPRAIFGPATAIMAAAGRQKPMIVILIAAVVLSALTIFQTFGTLGFLSIAVGYTAAISFAAVAQWWWTLRETAIDCSVFSMLTHARRMRAEQTDAKSGFAA